ncbi:Aurofusarin cluster transcription factor aurR2 [Colletotrichum orbiculare MAFF 240422]|uniref:Aurofusarin cluster transcription factor aurR2 n=1 Tax=Colletotrichum orbiculare (strain 104-T / ATCC 96160 / CBS 514.97 / LARS 414 / MAFF 240422) TaxID=1213857 RepID=N4UZJ8_COLOR|nr:Aurofusarin cluster transcription factor aurR2 [Colletotrichum orbiculare MAFF 240422]
MSSSLRPFGDFPSGSQQSGPKSLPVAKPCNACRRRKVKCDKNNPCDNCSRHGIPCVYDAQGQPGLATPESQQQLQDRVDRLERIIEEMKGFSIQSPNVKTRSSSFPSATSTELIDQQSEDTTAGDPGMQVYDEDVSYYLGPNYWLNLQDIVYEPQCLFRIDSDKTGKSPASPTAWPIGRNPTMPDLSYLHLHPEKEDILTNILFRHVEPFIRTLHEAHWRQQITDFRVGVCKTPADVEAAMFATQAMAVAAMPGGVVQQKIGKTKGDVLRLLQEASQLALERADILRSRKPLAFVALLYHIQMKFIVGDGEVAVSLLGLAGRFGTRLGLHRDPSHYSYSPWISNMRRRIWSHFELLNNPVYNLEGADSGLPYISDVRPATNANDSQWTPTRFAKPGSAPPDQEGITDMSFVLVRQHMCRTMQSIVEKRNESTSEDLSRLVEQANAFLKAKFMNHVVANSQLQTLLVSYYRSSLRTMGMLIMQTHAQQSGGSDADFRANIYQECVEILEEVTNGEAIAMQSHWGWLYRWPTMPITISNVLIGLAQQPNHPITDRAWQQMDEVFRRHNNDDISMRKFAAWRVIEALCDQAMLYHKQRSHERAWYARRLDQAQGGTGAKGKEPVALENATVDDILGDVQMFGHDTGTHGGVVPAPAFFASQQALDPLAYAGWNQGDEHQSQGRRLSHQSHHSLQSLPPDQDQL